MIDQTEDQASAFKASYAASYMLSYILNDALTNGHVIQFSTDDSDPSKRVFQVEISKSDKPTYPPCGVV